MRSIARLCYLSSEFIRASKKIVEALRNEGLRVDLAGTDSARLYIRSILIEQRCYRVAVPLKP